MNRVAFLFGGQPLGSEVGVDSVSYGFWPGFLKHKLDKFEASGHIRDFTPRSLKDLTAACGLPPRRLVGPERRPGRHLGPQPGHPARAGLSARPTLARMADSAASPAPPSAPAEGSLDLLAIYNGTLAGGAKGIGGGDQVMLKCLNLSGIRPDVLVPSSARGLLRNPGRVFETRPTGSLSTAGILVTFVARIFQALWLGWRQRRHTYQIAVSVSGFAVDLIPLWFWNARIKGAIVYHLLPERKAVNLPTRIRFGLAALEQWLSLRLLRHICDYMVAGNEVTRRQLQAYLPGKPIFVLHAGFDAAALDRVPAPPQRPQPGRLHRPAHLPERDL